VARYGGSWTMVLNTATDLLEEEGVPYSLVGDDSIMIEGHSVVVLKQPKFL
jgi:hypothetical protein